MTTSYFHNGTVHGDAIEAPYSAEVFSSLIASTYAPSRNCVIWNTAQNSLRVDGTAARAVDVNTGTAFIGGIVYTNTAVVNVSVPQNTTPYPRMDAVIVRFVADNNQARIALKNGIPASNPLPPDIKDNELLLAYLYLAPAFATVPSTVVYDKREFAFNSDHAKYFYTDNTMINSELISFSGARDPANASAPDYWTKTLTPLFYHANKFDQQARGRAVQIVADAAGEGMTTTLLTTEGTAKMFTLAVLIKIDSGICAVTFAGTAKNIYPSSDVQVIYIRVSTNGYQTLSFLSSGGAADFTVGQITLTQGYIPASFEVKSEVLFPTNYYSPSYAVSGLSTGPYPIIYTGFGSDVILLGYVKAVIVQIRARDSGSAGAGTIMVELGGVGAGSNIRAVLWLGGETNDTYKETFGISQFESTNDQYIMLDISASGAGTLDLTVYIIGIIV